MALDINKFIARFVEEARDHLRRMDEGLRTLETSSADAEVINSIFRSAHTIKGSSRMLKLDSIAATAHKLEDVLSGLRDKTLLWSPDLGRLLQRGIDVLAVSVENIAEGRTTEMPDAELLDDLSEALHPEAAAAHVSDADSPVASVSSSKRNASPSQSGDVQLRSTDTVRIPLFGLDELIKLMGEVVSSHVSLQQRLIDLRILEKSHAQPADKALSGFARDLRDDVYAQSLLMEELHAKALIMRMLPLSVLFESSARLVRELGRASGKEVDCIVSGMDIEMDRQLIDRLSDPVLHLLRNAVDHGIEAPEIRRELGKPRNGSIMLSAQQDGQRVVIVVSDDGAGIPVAAVKEKAISKGFYNAEQAAALTDNEVVDLIFKPGFSTSSIITDISGRGVGMDVVKSTIVDELHGAISVATEQGKGTSFVLRLPTSLAIMRVLLVSVGSQSFGFTAQYLVEILRLSEADVLSVTERRAVRLHNEFVPIVGLASLLGVPESSADKQDDYLLVVVKVGNEKVALQVDALLDERDRVIKPLPVHLRRLPLVSGMVSTGRNELVSILNCAGLMAVARQSREAAKSVAATPASRKVLVVDDSFNTREIMRDVLEMQGYAVMLAEDGQDGLNKALAQDFDAILTDVEMPNMDGFSLTAALRKEQRYRYTPIIIISSRGKEADKRRGIEVGADAYIVKGDFNQDNLLNTLKTLLG